MSRETSTTIKEDASLKAGLTVSAKYGPFVEVSASVEGSTSSSKQEATKSASKFSQDVTQRSAHKITERVLERSSLRVTNEVIEKNSHELGNVSGSANISGVYQWVNKVYAAQMFSDGLRTMFDFMIPEPGAFLIEAMTRSHRALVELEKPIEFTLTPSQLTESNYAYWLLKYGVTDAAPPPELFRTKSYQFAAGNAEANKNFTHATAIVIDDGYSAIEGCVGCKFVGGFPGQVHIILGRRPNRFGFGQSAVWVTPLDNERDSVRLGYNFEMIGVDITQDQLTDVAQSLRALAEKMALDP
jgi:hypothetical protein